MMPGVIVVALLAGLIAGGVMGVAWAIRNAPYMEDEPSQLDLWDRDGDL